MDISGRYWAITGLDQAISPAARGRTQPGRNDGPAMAGQGGIGVVSDTVASDCLETQARFAIPASRTWLNSYLRRAAFADGACALAGGILAAEARFEMRGYLPPAYLAFTCALPVFWWVSMMLAGAYDPRFIGLGSDEFRRVINAAVSLTAAVAIVSYAARLDLARGYTAVALPAAAILDLAGRYRLRKRLHRLRSSGYCTRRVIAAGHAAAVADLVTRLRRETHHGLAVVAACLVGAPDEAGGLADLPVAGDMTDIPIAGELGSVPAAVRQYGADTVAVLACPEMNGTRLRDLAWQLEKTSTDLCVAPALLDVAGPRTTIRAVAGLPLLHVDHPELAGARQVLKSAFDRLAAASALLLLAPVFAAIALAIKLTDAGPVFFRQARVGKGGELFTLYKFRTMVVDA
jgi:Bacterial sugar transferase